jgi:hypothetical protein
MGFSLRHYVQTGPMPPPPPVSYPVGISDSSLGSKAAGGEANHSSPSSAEIKNVWSYISTPRYFFIE